MIAGILGGIGIFLVGMILLTEGLKAAAGGALRGMLARVARGPASSIAAGVGVTALVQSSSATTLTTIGFVSAGLLTFTQAVGIILGANIGTTSTGWIVSLLGLKISISAIALPLVGAGALVRLLARGPRAELGLALAGFGLIFVGIDTLQIGMTGLAERFDPGSFPGATLGGRVLLVIIGVIMTVVMQSSSAAVATVLTALHAGTVSLEQTAYLVIGQNVGTTVKAALAALGASVPARRTALAHILFNLGAGALAVVLLPVLLPLSVRIAGEGDPAVAIALFHTSFNLIGVAAILPFLGPFSRWVEGLIPERESLLTRHLDPSVTRIPEVAVEAARRAAGLGAFHLFREARSGRRAPVPLLPLGRAPAPDPAEPPHIEASAVRSALLRIRSFLGQVHTPPDAGVEHARHLSVLHAVEHLERLSALLREDPELLAGASDEPLNWARERAELVRLLGAWRPPPTPLEEGSPADGASLAPEFRRASAALADVRKRNRDELLQMAAAGEVSPEQAGEAVDRLKRADALGYHAWRAVHHLERADPARFPTGRARGVAGAPEEPMDALDGVESSPGTDDGAPGPPDGSPGPHDSARGR